MSILGGNDGDRSGQTGGRVNRRSFLESVSAAAALGGLAGPASADSGSGSSNGPPNVEAESWCEAISLRNRSDESVEVTVDGSNGFTDVVPLGPDGRRTVQRLEPAEYTLTARTADDGEATINDSDSQTYQVSDCTDGQIPDLQSEGHCREFGFENLQKMGARVSVTADNGYGNLLDVAPVGESGLAALRDGEYTVTATADDGSQATVDGQESKTFTVPMPCPENEPLHNDLGATTDCGGTVSLENFTDQSIDVTVDGPNGFVKTVSVPAGSTTDVTGLTEWFEYVLTAQAADGTTASINGHSQAVVRVPNCPGSVTPNVEAGSNECETLTTTNTDADQTVDVSISGPGGYQNTVALGPDESRSLTGLAGGDYTLTAETSDGGAATVNGSDSTTVTVGACDAGGGGGTQTPDVGASSPECETISVTNRSDSTAVDVTVDGPSGTFTVTVDPGETRGIHNLDAGDYTVTARTVDGDPATVNGQDSDTVTVEGCSLVDPVL